MYTIIWQLWWYRFYWPIWLYLLYSLGCIYLIAADCTIAPSLMVNKQSFHHQTWPEDIPFSERATKRSTIVRTIPARCILLFVSRFFLFFCLLFLYCPVFQRVFYVFSVFVWQQSFKSLAFEYVTKSFCIPENVFTQNRNKLQRR